MLYSVFIHIQLAKLKKSDDSSQVWRSREAGNLAHLVRRKTFSSTPATSDKIENVRPLLPRHLLFILCLRVSPIHMQKGIVCSIVCDGEKKRNHLMALDARMDSGIMVYSSIGHTAGVAAWTYLEKLMLTEEVGWEISCDSIYIN